MSICMCVWLRHTYIYICIYVVYVSSDDDALAGAIMSIGIQSQIHV
jgi:hypothetical protein